MQNAYYRTLKCETLYYLSKDLVIQLIIRPWFTCHLQVVLIAGATLLYKMFPVGIVGMPSRSRCNETFQRNCKGSLQDLPLFVSFYLGQGTGQGLDTSILVPTLNKAKGTWHWTASMLCIISECQDAYPKRNLQLYPRAAEPQLKPVAEQAFHLPFP